MRKPTHDDPPPEDDEENRQVCAGCEQVFPSDEVSEAKTRSGTVHLCSLCMQDFLEGRGG